jgi:L-fuconolactonase
VTDQHPETDFSRTQRPDDAWLARALPEETIAPDLPIIDVHMHMWHHASGYRYFVEQHAQDIAEGGHNVEATVYVECGSMYRAQGPAHLRCVGETQFAAGMAAIAESEKYTTTRIAAGIVANSDLAADRDRVTEMIEAHSAAANGRLRGLRQRAKWDADPIAGSGVVAEKPGVLLDPALHDGLRVAASHDLLFEASVFHPQIPDVTAMARAVPEASIVLIHCGSPLGYGGYRGHEKEVHSAWLEAMRDLATCPNVTVKLGGILMSLGNFDFRTEPRPPTSQELADLWRPWLDPCLELFGAERCMAASNFPVEKAGMPYGTVWNMYKNITSGASPSQRLAVLSDTARRVYRL